MRILFLSRWLPLPANNGAKLRISGLLRLLAAEHELALVSAHEPGEDVAGSALEPLRALCRRVWTFPYPAFVPSSRQALLGLVRSTPRSLVAADRPELRALVRRAAAVHQPELVIASELQMLPYALEVAGPPLLLDDLELGIFRQAVDEETSPARRARARLTWLKLTAYLRRTLPRFAGCSVVSKRERTLVERAVPDYGRVAVIPNAIDLARCQGDYGLPEPDSLVYCGSPTYRPNFDAVTRFLADSFPAIKQQLPGVSLTVTGSLTGLDPARLPNRPDVRLLGQVADVWPVVARSWASVVPLRQGGGTRLKILESLALGTPVVSTQKGAEGLELADGSEILVADEPGEFAARCTALLRQPELRARLARAGRQAVAQRYDWSVVGPRFLRLVEQAASRRPSQRLTA